MAIFPHMRSMSAVLSLAVSTTILMARHTASHASVIMPPSRNSIDGEAGTPWSNGRHPPTGSIMPYGSPCSNGTSICNSGQSSFWFSQGCTIGCKVCTGNGPRIPNFDQCEDLPKPHADVLLDPQYRTTNLHTVFGSKEDFWKFNPWRAPGQAPVFDPCGMAGGSPIAGFNAAEYNTTIYAKQGDLGSKVLKPRPSGTVWKRGGLAKTRWEQAANHGGGYQFRLCKASEPLTEECFQRTPIAFASNTQTVRYSNGTGVEINATIVKTGGGKGWMRWPFPNYNEQQCDYVVPSGKHCDFACPGCKAPLYAADNACPCDCDKQYPGLPKGHATPEDFPQQVKYNVNIVIEDTLRVPADIPTGDYVLGWRWDAEMTSQIWQSCSDISIVDDVIV